MSDPRRGIPGVDRLLEDPAFRELVERHSRSLVVAAVREVQDDVRREMDKGGLTASAVDDPAFYADRTRSRIRRRERASLRPVINATGVVLHTNLGRAPLAEAARDAMARVGAGYSNLEFDLDAGRRGSRYVHCADLVRELTGAEDALVVNNAAAALVLALNALALNRNVLVSRGELVEIGGGFRIPEILERAGAKLVEVGSTNRTRLRDYRAAADEHGAALLLKVHRSNFRMSGFTEEATLDELAGLANELEVPLVHDLGSGLLADPASLGLPHEPRPADSLRAGAGVVAFSGDKLLGGPQAGILAGESRWIERLRSSPLCRALRVDKVTLAGLEATLRLYRDPETARREIPALAALARSTDELERGARRLAERLRDAGLEARAEPSSSAVGGGTYPEVELPSWAVHVTGPGGAEEVASALRAGSPPVVCRVADGAAVVDLRTLREGEADAVAARLTEVAGGGPDREAGGA